MNEDNEIIIESETEEPTSEDKSIVVSSDMLPPILPILPLYERPLFPEMMAPLLIEEASLQQLILEGRDSTSGHIGVLLVKGGNTTHQVLPEKPEQFYTTGVVAKVVQASPSDESDGPLNIVLQAIERFNTVEAISKKPVFHPCWRKAGRSIPTTPMNGPSSCARMLKAIPAQS